MKLKIEANQDEPSVEDNDISFKMGDRNKQLFNMTNIVVWKRGHEMFVGPYGYGKAWELACWP